MWANPRSIPWLRKSANVERLVGQIGVFAGGILGSICCAASILAQLCGSDDTVTKKSIILR